MRGPVVCALLGVLLISPWPIFALDYKRGVDPNLVAVPATGDSILSAVSPVFSRGRFFQIIDLRTDEIRVLSNPFFEAKHAAGLRSAFLLLREDVGVVIARHIGPEPFNNLSAREVRIYSGRPATVKEAVDLYRRGKLVRIDRPDVQIHYGLKSKGVAVPPTGPCPLAAPDNGNAAGQQPPQRQVGLQRYGSLVAGRPFAALGIEVVGVDGGVEVLSVEPGSPAGAGGVIPGDLIIRVDGRRVLDLQRFAALVEAHPPETTARLRIARRGRIETRLVTIREAGP